MNRVKISRNQLRRIIKEINIPNPVYIEDGEELKFKIAMKIKDMMPPEEALGMPDDGFLDLVLNVYETYFDPFKEGWSPYESDLSGIKDHLTVVPLPDDTDFDSDEHNQYYEEHPTFDESGEQDGLEYSFRKNKGRK